MIPEPAVPALLATSTAPESAPPGLGAGAGAGTGASSILRVPAPEASRFAKATCPPSAPSGLGAGAGTGACTVSHRVKHVQSSLVRYVLPTRAKVRPLGSLLVHSKQLEKEPSSLLLYLDSAWRDGFYCGLTCGQSSVQGTCLLL